MNFIINHLTSDCIAQSISVMEETKTVVANENFDWNAFENDLGVYSQPKEEIAEAYDKTLSNVNVGEVVEGTVTGITKREVLVNIGYKSEGVIPVSEFRYNPDLAVGDKIEVYVESAEDKNGQLALSHKKARQLKSWDRVNEALEKDEIIKGYIKCRTKGGMIVDVFGIEAFLPGSQIDDPRLRRIRGQDHGIQGRQDQSGVPQRGRFAQGAHRGRA